MPTPQKEAIVKDMTEKFSNASSIFLADFTGIDVNTLVDLRKKFYNENVEYRVIKNTLAKRSFEQAGIKGLDDYLAGVNGYMISYDDPTTPVKIIDKLKKELEGKFALKAAYFDGEVVHTDQVAALAQLPSKQELLGQLVGMLKSPIRDVASVLHASMRNVLGVLKSLEEKKS